MEITLEEFTYYLNHSNVSESLKALENLWSNGVTYDAILEAAIPAALSSFSHRYSSMHVPKENEYLRRFLSGFSRDKQLDFLKRYIEYLAWSPKYIVDSAQALATDSENNQDLHESYLNSLEDDKGIPALHYIQRMAEESLEEATRTILQVGCVDVSQAIGHYFSCTESMIKLAQESGMPKAGDNFFQATLYLIQSGPIRLSNPEKPSMGLEDILSELVRKTGFVGYHYMILANGLINQRDFLGEKYYSNGIAGLEKMLPKLSDGMSIEYLDNFTKKTEIKEYSLKELKDRIWKGDKAGAFTILRKYYNDEGLKNDLEKAILHSYTMIDDRPHDPHYVTAPRSLFELMRHLKEDDIILALAHSAEFAVNRVQSRGVKDSL